MFVLSNILKNCGRMGLLRHKSIKGLIICYKAQIPILELMILSVLGIFIKIHSEINKFSTK
jgi:hypothetical protein